MTFFDKLNIYDIPALLSAEKMKIEKIRGRMWWAMREHHTDPNANHCPIMFLSIYLIKSLEKNQLEAWNQSDKLKMTLATRISISVSLWKIQQWLLLMF